MYIQMRKYLYITKYLRVYKTKRTYNKNNSMKNMNHEATAIIAIENKKKTEKSEFKQK